MTRRLYYGDSYQTGMQSAVQSISADGLRVVLDDTVFYPNSGGQPHDLGTLNEIPVVDVIDAGEAITHVLATRFAGEHASGEIDWKRRYDHMQQHSGQHLLSAVFEELFSIATLSFRMGAEMSTIELEAKEISGQQMEQAVHRANELARENRRVMVSFEAAASAEGLRKASQRQGELRIVEITGVDRSACGGTHVRSLAEVLPLQIRESEKVRGNVRISFVCGDRAMQRSHLDFQTLSALAKSFSSSFDDLLPKLVALQKRLGDVEKQRQSLETDAAKRTGADLYVATNPGEDGLRRIALAVDEIDETLRTKAKVFAANPKAVFLAHGPKGLLIACSPDSGISAADAVTKAGLRGGGSATMAQGSFSESSALDVIKKLLGL